MIEMAEASGLPLVPKDQRNPLQTTTYGTGELIIAALDEGVKHIIIGLGGSSTNDGGAGMAQALGVRFSDDQGNEITDYAGGGILGKIAKIDISGLDARLKQTEILVACDVDNPLCGERGASHVFGPQKGATADMVRTLDSNLEHFANQIEAQLGKSVKDISGAGAAGGLGAGLLDSLSDN